MNSYPQSISTFSISAGAYQTYTAIRASVLKLTVFGIFIPMILSELILSHFSIPTVNALKDLTEQFLSGNKPPNYRTLLEVSTQFFSPCILIMFLLLFVFFSAYMGLIKIAVAREKDETLPTASSSFIWGMRQFFPKGLILLIIFLFFSLERYFWGPFRIFSMLILMSPVLFTLEGGRMWASVRRSLLMKYVSPSISTGFNVAFTLIVFGAIFFFGESLIGSLSKALLNFDQLVGLPRDLWTVRFFDFPFTWVFFFVNLIGSFAFALLLTCLPLFTVTLYFRVHRV